MEEGEVGFPSLMEQYDALGIGFSFIDHGLLWSEAILIDTSLRWSDHSLRNL